MYLEHEQLCAALAVRDLTNPSYGLHGMQQLCADIAAAMAAWGTEVRVVRGSPVVTSRDNYDRLYVPSDGMSRDARYTRWIGPGVMLRSQMSAMIPSALEALARDPSWRDVLLLCPGLVYRRDCIDRHHVGEPHQMDLWRIRRDTGTSPVDDAALDDAALRAMVDRVIGAALPGWTPRVSSAAHPYTERGLQIEAAITTEIAEPWLEVGECGLAAPRVLADAGLDPAHTSGLAMGLGLDRLMMLRKGVGDIRLLRAQDPRIAAQMLDLSPYRPVSTMPPSSRDLSIAIDVDDAGEELGDRVRASLGARSSSIESVAILSETPYDAVPAPARARIGLAPGQKNVLVRVVLRDLERTLTAAEGNALRDQIYAALHRGSAHQWSAR